MGLSCAVNDLVHVELRSVFAVNWLLVLLCTSALFCCELRNVSFSTALYRLHPGLYRIFVRAGSCGVKTTYDWYRCHPMVIYVRSSTKFLSCLAVLSEFCSCRKITGVEFRSDLDGLVVYALHISGGSAWQESAGLSFCYPKEPEMVSVSSFL